MRPVTACKTRRGEAAKKIAGVSLLFLLNLSFHTHATSFSRNMAMNASATELVVAFVMGMGGSLLYAWEGFVDIRLSMIILAGSLFGIQLGAIGTTYVRDHTVKFVMGMIMLIVLLSRLFKLPVYFSDLGWTPVLSTASQSDLGTLSYATLAVALIAGAGMILTALLKGVAEHRRRTLGNTQNLAVD